MGHDLTIFGSSEWPVSERPAGRFVAMQGRTPGSFARELQHYHPSEACDVVFSLERVAECDFWRAGDGVHASWLERRKVLEPWWKSAWRMFDGKHRQLLGLEQRMLRSPRLKGVIANSRLVAEELQRFHGLDPAKIHVVYNGLPKADFRFHPGMRADARARLDAGPDDVLIAFVGTGWVRKGLPWAIEAVELCARKTGSPLRLIVAGRGNSKNLANRRTSFIGPVKPVTPLLMAADIFILPTIYDPFSNATLEAYATGLPVLTTKANGFSEVMEQPIDGQVLENGWDIQVMAAALERMLPLVSGVEARLERVKRASKYTMDLNLEETLRIINTGMSSSVSSAPSAPTPAPETGPSKQEVPQEAANPPRNAIPAVV
jgi:UDP-glucose:(heptosyl)LPS alpha-1,3-glucosyltransferase